MQKQEENKRMAQGGIAHVEAVNLIKRIGSTNYHVSIHYSQTSKESLEDKLYRLIEQEVGKVA